MSLAPYTDLQATPDFATFQFVSPTLPEPSIRQVKFNGHQGGRIYHVEFRNKPGEKKDGPSWPDSREFFCVVLTTLQIIEIYSERYARRILRFNCDTTLKALVFGTILTRFHHLLSPLFLIEPENPGPNRAGGTEPSCGLPGEPHAFLLKRKPIPFFSMHTIESTWNGTSRIFNNQFSIELDKSIRIGLTMPTM